MGDIVLPLLPTIKCSDCNIFIDIRLLDHHKCSSYEKKKAHAPAKLMEINTSRPPMPPQPAAIQQQRHPGKKSSGLNNSVKRIFRKIKGDFSTSSIISKYDENSLSSPTFSTISSSTATSSLVTPRLSAEDFFQQYILKQDADILNSRIRSNNSSIRASSISNSVDKPLGEEENEDLQSVIGELIVTINKKKIAEVCAACSQNISTEKESLEHNGMCYYKACYCCTLCKTQLSLSSSWKFSNGKIYCKRDYEVMLSRSQNTSSLKSSAPILSKNIVEMTAVSLPSDQLKNLVYNRRYLYF